MNEILGAIRKQGEAFECYQQVNDERLGGLKERLEHIEAIRSNPARAYGQDSIEAEHAKRFCDWLRKPDDVERKNALSEIEKRLSTKDVTISSDISGGFAVPEILDRMVEKFELEFSPVRRIVKVQRVGSSDYKHLLSERGTSAGWVGENGSRTATATSTLRERAPTMGEIYAYPQVSEWALDDVFFDVGRWIAEEVAEKFAEMEGQAVIDGNGNNRPTGMLNSTPVLSEDGGSPLRDASTYQYVVSDTDVDASPSEPGVRFDSLIDLVYTVRSQYRANGTWVMNSLTAASVRKLKDTQGRYLWTDSLIQGQPPLLLGYPVEMWEQMPDIGAGNFPIAFGDFRRGYLLVDRVGLRITRDNVTNPGHVRFYVRRREGGTPLNNDAIKFLRTID